MQTQADITHSIFTYAKNNGVYTIIINGDFFETKNYISSSLYNFMWEIFKGYSYEFNIILNTGNQNQNAIVTIKFTYYPK